MPLLISKWSWQMIIRSLLKLIAVSLDCTSTTNMDTDRRFVVDFVEVCFISTLCVLVILSLEQMSWLLCQTISLSLLLYLESCRWEEGNYCLGRETFQCHQYRTEGSSNCSDNQRGDPQNGQRSDEKRRDRGNWKWQGQFSLCWLFRNYSLCFLRKKRKFALSKLKKPTLRFRWAMRSNFSWLWPAFMSWKRVWNCGCLSLSSVIPNW